MAKDSSYAASRIPGKVAPTGSSLHQLTVRYPVNSKELPRHEPANFFHFAGIGNDVQMSIGIVDPVMAANVAPRGQPIEPIISHRVLMSIGSLQLLHRQVNDMVKKLSLPPMDPSSIQDVND